VPGGQPCASGGAQGKNCSRVIAGFFSSTFIDITLEGNGPSSHFVDNITYR
jgi:hypothetical protein